MEEITEINIDNNLDSIINIEKLLSYTFNDKFLLLNAITHPSAVLDDSTHLSYERLEFLGDSILNAVVSEDIYRMFPDFDEGRLTKIRVTLVSGENLSKIADNLGLSDYIIFGKSEEHTGKRGMKSALENVLEAIIAALYLDGGIQIVKDFVRKNFLNENLSEKYSVIQENPKSKLQELLQMNNKIPTYEIVSEYGPDHDKTFIAKVCVNDKFLANGKGRTKKEAEKNAAFLALDKIS